jgi:hypothetical protein
MPGQILWLDIAWMNTWNDEDEKRMAERLCQRKGGRIETQQAGSSVRSDLRKKQRLSCLLFLEQRILKALARLLTYNRHGALAIDGLQ